MVANAFIPNPDNKPYVDHIDGVRYHNFVENLRWCTQKENMNYELAIRNKTKYNFPIEGVGYDGKVCVEFLNYKDAQKKGFDRTLIKKAVDTGKPYKGIHYRIKIEKQKIKPLAIKIKVVYLHHQTRTTGRFPGK